MQFKTKPFAHQLEEFELTREMPTRALFWEMGCVDSDTEYLSPDGWRRLAHYQGGEVAGWDPETEESTFVVPLDYVRKPAGKMVHLGGGRSGTDQVLSLDHRVPVMTKRGTRIAETISAKDVVGRLLNGKQLRLPSKFWMGSRGEGISLTDRELQLQIAVMADGSFPRSSQGTRRCIVRLKKARKVKRLRSLLRPSDNVYERPGAKGFTIFSFTAPLRTKIWPMEWWTLASQGQAELVVAESQLWDGHVRASGGWSFFSRHESDVDLLQFFAASGGAVTQKVFSSGIWNLHVRGVLTNGYVLNAASVSEASSVDGYQYCFRMPSGFWIARRNGRTFPTGNCGKSKPVIDTAASLFLDGHIGGMLIVAPTGVHRNWVTDELPAHLPDEVADHAVTLLWQTSRAKTQQFMREVGAFLRPDPGRFHVLAMSYDSMMTDLGRKAAKAFLETVDTLYALDESAFIKTPGSKRTKRVLASAKYAPFRRVMTGTPVDNSPFDVFSQVKFLEPDAWHKYGCRNFSAFKSNFGIFERRTPRQGRAFMQLIRYKNLGILHDVVDRVGSRLLKADVLDLPPKLYTKHYFDLTSAQRRLYEQIRMEFIAWFGDGSTLTADLAITRLLRLQQITSNYLPTDEEEKLRPISDPNPRIQALKQVCAGIPGQAIIWAKYNVDVDAIMSALREEGHTAVSYDGRVDEAARARAKDSFKAGNAKFFVSKPAVGGTGLTLTEATVVVYYNNGFRLSDRLQSEDRAHRIGQENKVTYVDLVAQGTVDEYIIAKLVGKRDMAAEVMGDNLGDWI